MQQNKLFALLLLATLVLAGCLNQQESNPPQNSTSQEQTVVPTGFQGNLTELVLTAQETGFEVTDYSELSPGENGTELQEAGYESGYSVGLAKFDEVNFERIVHQVTKYNSTQGAAKGFEQTQGVIRESNEIIAELSLPQLGEKQFGLKGSRVVDLGGKTVAIDDYIIVFLKSDILVAVDYFGLSESVSEEKAIELAQKAASKFG